MISTSDLRACVRPNHTISPGAFTVVSVGWVTLLLIVWSIGGSVLLPSPIETIRAFPQLWFRDGLGIALMDSFWLNLQAAVLMSVLSLMVAYATVVPLGRVNALLVSAGRFNGFVGLPLVFLALLHNPHWVKIALLVFGAGVFTVLSVAKLVDSIPKEQFDHSRTLRMSEWRVVWEVVILGQFDQVIDILRVNVAMMWMMLPMVEGLFRFEGGVGALMLDESKHMNLDAVFCALFVILGIGLLQDWAIGYMKGLICPYAELGLER